MANAITVGRLLLFIAVYVLYHGGVNAIAAAAIAIGIAIVLDGLDGWVARRYNETGPLGGRLRHRRRSHRRKRPLGGLCRSWPHPYLGSIAHADSWLPGRFIARHRVRGRQNRIRREQHDALRLTQWLTAGRPMRLLFGWAKLLAFVFLGGLVAYDLRGAPGTWLGDLYSWGPFRYAGWICVGFGGPQHCARHSSRL